ncbi:hypothetical protein BC938DRAFT_478325 [Jimgerdemannia flammicorona]|uniref:Uncharacterized protein n=1 Tax=Jimgerdemannia flammicorona TaxID=994334 RepID=A0A433QN18_9FUNG|nr:hypothetical protein BC938DRAFT_478325 [Jimgerdemannia flammicorona]
MISLRSSVHLVEKLQTRFESLAHGKEPLPPCRKTAYSFPNWRSPKWGNAEQSIWVPTQRASV